MTTHCTDRLSDYLDDELPPAERGDVAAHLAECAACASTLDELRALRAQATALPGSIPPVTDAWPGIEARLAPRRGQAGVRSWRVSFSLPQLAAAAALVLAVGMGSMWMLPTRHVPDAGAGRAAQPADVVPAGLADASFDAAVADLEALLDEGRAHLDPATIRVLEENLAAVDAAIAQARQALAADPGNIGLANHLLRTRGMRLGVLRRAVAGTRPAG